MAHKGNATSDVTYNPDDGPEAYNNPAVYSRIHDYTAMAQDRRSMAQNMIQAPSRSTLMCS
jgi:hypothetical protein